MGPFLPNELEQARGSARASEETEGALEEAQIFPERESRLRKNRRPKYFSRFLQRPATSDGFDAMATGCRETVHSLNSTVEPAFSPMQCL
jgi:hypothetical protein